MEWLNPTTGPLIVVAWIVVVGLVVAWIDHRDAERDAERDAHHDHDDSHDAIHDGRRR